MKERASQPGFDISVRDLVQTPDRLRDLPYGEMVLVNKEHTLPKGHPFLIGEVDARTKSRIPYGNHRITKVSDEKGQVLVRYIKERGKQGLVTVSSSRMTVLERVPTKLELQNDTRRRYVYFDY